MSHHKEDAEKSASEHRAWHERARRERLEAARRAAAQRKPVVGFREVRLHTLEEELEHIENLRGVRRIQTELGQQAKPPEMVG